jgi:hypothetical protein
MPNDSSGLWELLLILEGCSSKGYHPGHRHEQLAGAGSTFTLNASSEGWSSQEVVVLNSIRGDVT